MFFNTVNYAIFLLIVVIINYILPKRVRYIWLLAASYFFYGSWNAKYTLLILLVTIVTYFGGMLIQNNRNNQSSSADTCVINYNGFILGTCLIICFAILVYFKYSNFIIQNINSVTYRIMNGKTFSALDILLPVGISFYVFQSVGYVIDVYRGTSESENNFFRYALFISFFPQLVAGPIERSNNLLSQLKKPNDFTPDRLREGLILIGIGVWQKVLIADSISYLIDPVFENPMNYYGVSIVFSVILFGFQIYCDFGGYTNIAIGSAKILGIDLMRNFESPYLATSVTDFWSRWHISLTSWFRDYLYIPLGGNRKGKIRKYVNTIIVFAASGAWHGAAYKYILWGMLNGIMMIFSNIRKEKNATRENSFSKIDNVFRIIGTFILVDFTWLFFRASSCEQAISMIVHSIKTPGVNALYAYDIIPKLISEQLVDGKRIIVVILSIVLLLLLDAVQKKTGNFIGYLSKQKMIYRWLFYFTIVIMTITFGVYGVEYNQTGFIYFQF